MTPAYVYEEMTWAEIGAAMDYVYRYDVTERHARGAKKIWDWIYRGRDTFGKELKALAARVKNG
jgi:hypothetical protein